jgi:hypothetical protein
MRNVREDGLARGIEREPVHAHESRDRQQHGSLGPHRERHIPRHLAADLEREFVARPQAVDGRVDGARQHDRAAHGCRGALRELLLESAHRHGRILGVDGTGEQQREQQRAGSARTQAFTSPSTLRWPYMRS